MKTTENHSNQKAILVIDHVSDTLSKSNYSALNGQAALKNSKFHKGVIDLLFWAFKCPV